MLPIVPMINCTLPRYLPAPMFEAAKKEKLIQSRRTGTKRPETRWPSEERSAKLRKDGFLERRTKKVLNRPYLENHQPGLIGG
jgi:hypothetical protein